MNKIYSQYHGKKIQENRFILCHSIIIINIVMFPANDIRFAHVLVSI